MQILLVEDNPADAMLVRIALEEAESGDALTVATDGVEALDRLRQGEPPDLVLLDVNLPKLGGLEVLAEMKADGRLSRIPAVVLSSSSSDRDITRAAALGATGYVTKPALGFEEAIRDVLAFARRLQPVAPLPGRPAWMTAPDFRPEALLSAAGDAIVGADLDGVVTAWNQAAAALLGWTAEEVVGKPLRTLAPDGGAELGRILDEVRRGATHRERETVHVHRSGRALDVAVTASPVRDASGSVVGVVAILRDVGERKRAEERFRLAVEASPSGVLMVGPDGRVLLANAEAERMFGYSREQLVGLAVEQLMPHRFRGGHPGHRAAFMADPEARPMGAGRDLYALRRDGVEFPVEIGLSPLRTSDGTIVLASVIDITERKRAEERFALAVEASPNGMVMVDQEGRIVLVNAETERLFGYERSELVGEPVERLVPKAVRGRHPELRARFLDAPRKRAMGAGRDLSGVRRDGSEFPVEIGLNPIETEQGWLVLASIVDITERKRSAEELAGKARNLERSNAELERFAFIASHDLKEPLRTISSYGALLERKYGVALDDTARQYLGIIVGASTRAHALVQDLLTYARAGSEGPSKEPAPLQKALDAALANLGGRIAETSAVVEHDEPLPHVNLDLNSLTEVVQNLVGNALKFRRPEVPPRVRVSAAPDAGGWVVSVSDNGIGIEPRYLERIFELFERLTPRADDSGTGLGLAICKRIVESAGGWIRAESTPGEGTTFRFWLPGSP